MKIKVDLKIFYIILLYILTRKIKLFTIAFIFIILHECGHILSGLILGLKIKNIKWNIAGLSLEFSNYGKQRNINKIIISISGPAINLIAAIISILLKQNILICINIGLFMINILPIYPLDGGQILENILLYKNNYKKTRKIVEKISKNTLIILSFLGSIFILIYKNISIFIIVIYLWGVYLKERKNNKIIKKAYQVVENNL